MALTPLTQAPNAGTIRVTPRTPIPVTLANGATWDSDLCPAGAGSVMFALTADRVLTVNIQRYADLAGLVPVGAVVTAPTVAATPLNIQVNDGVPYLSFNLQLVNASGALATIANAAILTGPR